MPALLWCVGFVWLAGCGGAGFVPRYPHTSARQALASLQASRASVRGLQAEARVDQRGTEGRVRGTVWMFVERPSSVRFDVMTQFGPASVLTSDGRVFALHDLKHKRFMTGPSCPANIARLLGLPMSATETVSVLLGQAPALGPAQESIHWHRDGYYRIERRWPDGRRQELDLRLPEHNALAKPRAQQLVLQRVALFGARGRLTWHVRYDDYKLLSGPSVPCPNCEAEPRTAPRMPVAVERVEHARRHEPSGSEPRTVTLGMPFKVRIEQPSFGRDVVVRFKSITLNPEVPADAYAQEPRPGVVVEHMACEIATQ